jgi:hypothetical protein
MSADASSPLPVSYVLPLRRPAPAETEFGAYVRGLSGLVDEVLVVDGSDDPVFAAHAADWGEAVTHLPPDRAFVTANGKVAGVLTGLARARHDAVVIADDDVRYDRASVEEVARRLDRAEAVLPQNVFRPLPWHARWDTGRILVQRALGGDMGGTVAVRRAFLAGIGGYDGDVMFENLELVRTIRAAGGRVEHARDVFVPREPPTAAHFVSQRVRQAYDELARPWRLAVSLAALPAFTVAARRRRALALGAFAAVAAALAEAGRRRDGGRQAFGPSAALWAPAWALERAVTSWLAVGARLRGGVRYRDGRILRAATPSRALRRRFRERGLPGSAPAALPAPDVGAEAAA